MYTGSSGKKLSYTFQSGSCIHLLACCLSDGCSTGVAYSRPVYIINQIHLSIMVERLVNTEVNARRLVAVEQNFGSSGQSLSDPGRVLVGEGILTKLCRKKPKSRQFFLCNDILIYGTIVGKKK